MNKSNPKISVLMCVYNGETYLQEAIDSILKQTFEDFELVIVDDGSNDDSWNILSNYAQHDKRIKMFKNKKNLGLTKSLNQGIKLAKGEYIARQDADDVSLSHRLQLQVDYLDKHPKIGAVGSAVEFIDERGNILGQQELPSDAESLQALLLINNCLWHSSMTFRRRLVENLGGYDEEMVCTQDYDLWWRMSCHSYLATLSDILLRYRQDNPRAITKLKRKKQLQCSHQISYRAIQESLQKKGLTPVDEKAYERLWWAYLELIDKQSYQKWYYEERGESGLLHHKDMKLLKSFWSLLANNAETTKIWGERFYQLSNHLLGNKQTLVGLQLLWILKSRLHISIQWKATIKALIKPYISGIRQLRDFYRKHHFLSPKIDQV